MENLEHRLKPPRWGGTIFDPPPWGPVDPPPWWWRWRVRIPELIPEIGGPETDPPPIRARLLDIIADVDKLAFERARLEATIASMQATVSYLEKQNELLEQAGGVMEKVNAIALGQARLESNAAQLEAQLNYVRQQQKILGGYK